MLKLLIPIAFIILGYPLVSLADFECSAVISYTWKRQPNNQGVPTVAATPEAQLQQVVEWGRAEALAADEEAAKRNLAQVIQTHKNKALESCKKEHESQADCLATKYASMASVINSLRFEARKSLEQAINSDCQAQLGTCVSAEAGESKCINKDAAAAQGTPAADAEGAKAEGKAKKK